MGKRPDPWSQKDIQFLVEYIDKREAGKSILKSAQELEAESMFPGRSASGIAFQYSNFKNGGYNKPGERPSRATVPKVEAELHVAVAEDVDESMVEAPQSGIAFMIDSFGQTIKEQIVELEAKAARTDQLEADLQEAYDKIHELGVANKAMADTLDDIVRVRQGTYRVDAEGWLKERVR